MGFASMGFAPDIHDPRSGAPSDMTSAIVRKLRAPRRNARRHRASATHAVSSA
jgi:hypothetical protein